MAHRTFLLATALAIALANAPGCSDAAAPPQPASERDAAGSIAGTSVSTPDAERTPSEEAPSRIASTAVEDAAPPHSALPSDVFFGDLHVHSSWSLDAYAAGVEVGPRSAYAYARGEAIAHYSGDEIRLTGPPLDFLALTDHAEYLGLTIAASQPGHPLLEQPLIKSWLSKDPARKQRAWARIMKTYAEREGLPALMDDSIIVPAWRALVQLANSENQPGRFTTFVGFEYSPNPTGQNLHRNVIFEGGEAPDHPFSAMDSPDPEDLWDWMDRVRTTHGDLLAIPHNANGSNGLMFAESRSGGGDIDAAWAAQRARNEPVAEAIQIKGQSETHPALSPDDPWADFEIADWRTTRPSLPSAPSGSYLRQALRRGLAIEARLGVNPFALGMIGSTDGHNASSPTQESNYTGKIGRMDATPEQRLDLQTPANPAREPFVSTGTYWSAAGLAAIWAHENSRSALFAALRRRESYATSGPRLRVRLFAGWQFSEADAVGDIGPVGYAKGVPMGGSLRHPSHSEKPLDPTASPNLLVSAQRDPLEAPLERVQIIKGWWLDGETHERVFDVACAGEATPDPKTHRCPGAARDPDLTTCTPFEADGASELAVRWQDPEYDPRASVFYYARVLQIPTCRWSTFDALTLGRPPPSSVPATIQERAITSPIWIEPAEPRAVRD